MDKSYYTTRLETLTARIKALGPRIERARQSVRRLETESVTVGASAAAHATQLSSARTMVATLEDRNRKLRIAEIALRAEITSA